MTKLELLKALDGVQDDAEIKIKFKYVYVKVEAISLQKYGDEVEGVVLSGRSTVGVSFPPEESRSTILDGVMRNSEELIYIDDID